MDTAYRRKRANAVAKEIAREEVEKEDLEQWEQGRE